MDEPDGETGLKGQPADTGTAPQTVPPLVPAPPPPRPHPPGLISRLRHAQAGANTANNTQGGTEGASEGEHGAEEGAVDMAEGGDAGDECGAVVREGNGEPKHTETASIAVPGEPNTDTDADESKGIDGEGPAERSREEPDLNEGTEEDDDVMVTTRGQYDVHSRGGGLSEDGRSEDEDAPLVHDDVPDQPPHGDVDVARALPPPTRVVSAGSGEKRRSSLLEKARSWASQYVKATANGPQHARGTTAEVRGAEKKQLPGRRFSVGVWPANEKGAGFAVVPGRDRNSSSSDDNTWKRRARGRGVLEDTGDGSPGERVRRQRGLLRRMASRRRGKGDIGPQWDMEFEDDPNDSGVDEDAAEAWDLETHPGLGTHRTGWLNMEVHDRVRGVRWKRSWFVLQNGRLWILNSDGSHIPKEFLPLVDAQVVDCGNYDTSAGYGFSVITPERVLRLGSEFRHDKGIWMQELGATIGRQCIIARRGEGMLREKLSSFFCESWMMRKERVWKVMDKWTKGFMMLHDGRVAIGKNEKGIKIHDSFTLTNCFLVEKNIFEVDEVCKILLWVDGKPTELRTEELSTARQWTSAIHLTTLIVNTIQDMQSTWTCERRLLGEARLRIRSKDVTRRRELVYKELQPHLRARVWKSLVLTSALAKKVPGGGKNIPKVDDAAADAEAPLFGASEASLDSHSNLNAAMRTRQSRVLRLAGQLYPQMTFCPQLVHLVSLASPFLPTLDLYTITVAMIEVSKGNELYFLRSEAGFYQHARTVNGIIYHYNPALCNFMIDTLGLYPHSLYSDWARVLFCGYLPMRTALRVCDCFVSEGKDFLLKVAAALLRSAPPALIQATSREDFVEQLSEHCGAQEHAESLLEAAAGINLAVCGRRLSEDRAVVIPITQDTEADERAQSDSGGEEEDPDSSGHEEV